MSLTELTKSRDVLARVLSIAGVNQLGRETGQAKRLRTVTPHRLFLAIVSALAGTRVESLADLLRTFNHQNGVRVAYKPFYNRLARTGFEAFMREMCTRLIEHLRVQTLAPDGETAVARFTDIVIQDGSSFAIKRTLQGVFPGRLTTIEPAARGRPDSGALVPVPRAPPRLPRGPGRGVCPRASPGALPRGRGAGA